MSAALYVGIDAGSTTIKGVALAEEREVVRRALMQSTGDYRRDIGQVWDELESADSTAGIAATGYAQDLVAAALDREVYTRSEISCHARGANWMQPAAGLVIDVGGQDLKVIAVSPQGTPLNFRMNDKCAAGTGRFLDVMARALGVPVGGLAELAAQATQAAKITSMCTVFAESEVVTLQSRGESPANIAQGLLDSIGERIYSMALRVGPAQGIVMTGGGALNSGVVAAVGKRLKCDISVPEYPQLAGALGAALTAARQ